MEQYIGCDAHKRYSVFVTVNERCEASRTVRVDHDGGQMGKHLRSLPPGSDIALEVTGSWYWLVDEIEHAGHRPHLVNAGEANRSSNRPPRYNCC